MLNRNLYKVKGKYIATNHKRAIEVYAKTQQDAIDFAVANGFKEPFEVLDGQLEPPSERQVNYAQSLGIIVTNDMCKEDVSCLISRKTDDRSDPKPGLLQFADNHNIVFSNFIGKKTLYNIVFYNLPDLDKCAFFIFSVYRYLSDDRESNLDLSPYKNIFYEFANTYCTDKKFLKSMVEKYIGADLRFFGDLTVDKFGKSETYTGGTIKSYAYKAAKQYLIDAGLLPPDIGDNKTVTNIDKNVCDRKISDTTTEKIAIENPEQNRSEPDQTKKVNKGCIYFVIGLVIFCIILILIFEI